MNAVLGRVVAGYAGARKANKYKAKPVEIDGIRFPSIKQGKRYKALKLLQAEGRIRNLRLEVPYAVKINGATVCVYRADFVYDEYAHGSWAEVVEDVKGMKTPVYNLKKRLMKACNGIEIRES